MKALRRPRRPGPAGARGGTTGGSRGRRCGRISHSRAAVAPEHRAGVG